MTDRPPSSEIDENDPDYPALIEQRFRNRMIEHWSWVRSKEETLGYQSDVSHMGISVASEIFNDFLWDTNNPILDAEFPDPTYTSEERKMLRKFINFFNDFLKNGPDLEIPEYLETPEWERLRQAAEDAYLLFMQRGMLPENTLWQPPSAQEIKEDETHFQKKLVKSLMNVSLDSGSSASG